MLLLQCDCCTCAQCDDNAQPCTPTSDFTSNTTLKGMLALTRGIFHFMSKMLLNTLRDSDVQDAGVCLQFTHTWLLRTWTCLSKINNRLSMSVVMRTPVFPEGKDYGKTKRFVDVEEGGSRQSDSLLELLNANSFSVSLQTSSSPLGILGGERECYCQPSLRECGLD